MEFWLYWQGEKATAQRSQLVARWRTVFFFEFHSKAKSLVQRCGSRVFETLVLPSAWRGQV